MGQLSIHFVSCHFRLHKTGSLVFFLVLCSAVRKNRQELFSVLRIVIFFKFVSLYPIFLVLGLIFFLWWYCVNKNGVCFASSSLIIKRDLDIGCKYFELYNLLFVNCHGNLVKFFL